MISRKVDEIFLFCKVLCIQLTEPVLEEITDANDVGSVNLYLHSLFQQMDVSLNDVPVSQSAETYAYRAYIESHLSYGPQAKTSQLTAALYYKDTAVNIYRPNMVTLTLGHVSSSKKRNYGLQKRASFTDRSAIVDMIGHIYSDIFFQNRLLNEINVKVRLVRNKDSFFHVGRSKSIV